VREARARDGASRAAKRRLADLLRWYSRGFNDDVG